MSIVCPSFLTFPWQPLVSCRFGQKLTFLTHLCIFFQFSSSNSKFLPICTFHKHSGLILSQSLLFLDFLRKRQNPRCKSKMAGQMTSFDIICHHNQQIWYHFIEKAQGYLINVNFCRGLPELKPKVVPSTSPLYHGGSTS